MNLYTIGFSKKSAKQFFELLTNNGVKRLVDIRLNNKSQLAGFTKQDDLKYFLKAIGNIEYVYMPIFAPTEELLKGYQQKKVNWDMYEKEYLDILKKRDVLKNMDFSVFDSACLLCSEDSSEQCHRRLAAEYIAKHNNKVKVVHLK